MVRNSYFHHLLIVVSHFLFYSLRLEAQFADSLVYTIESANDDSRHITPLYPSPSSPNMILGIARFNADSMPASSAVRFQNIQLDQNETIDSAFLHFHILGLFSGEIPVNITCEQGTKPEHFSHQAFDLSNRTRVEDTTFWLLKGTWEEGTNNSTIIRSPDISNLLKLNTTSPAWQKDDNAIVFILEPSKDDINQSILFHAYAFEPQADSIKSKFAKLIIYPNNEVIYPDEWVIQYANTPNSNPTFIFSIENQEQIYVRCFSPNGQLVFKDSFQNSKGIYELTQLSNYPSSVYFIEFIAKKRKRKTFKVLHLN